MTISKWCKSSLRPWPEVLKVFHQAGTGLAAAHAAGLVHRDFKPANAIIGASGRVRVLDFGMVHMGGSVQEESSEMDSAPRESDEIAAFESDVLDGPSGATPLTLTGMFLGTPAFASPEQVNGQVVDARSDQYSFCVSLYMALYGQRPFAGTRLRQRLLAARHGEVKPPPKESKVPGWVHAAIVKGLQPLPEDRWASMEDLLSTLQMDPNAHRRKKWGMAALLVVMTLIPLVGRVAIRPNRAAQELCQDAPSRLGKAWTTERQAQISDRFSAVGQTEGWRHTKQALDGYAKAWVVGWQNACEASTEGEETFVLQEQMRCLRDRRQRLDVLTQALIDAEPVTLGRAVFAARNLPRIGLCQNLEYLSARVKPPDHPDTKVRVRRLRTHLIRAQGLLALGQFDRAAGVVQAVNHDIEALAYAPLSAETWLLRGRLAFRQGNYKAAEDCLTRAFFEARRVSYREIAGRAATEQVFLVGYKQGEAKPARLWAQLAEDELRNAGTPEDRAMLVRNRGILAEAQGDYDTAVMYYRDAVRLWTQALGVDHPQVARARNSLGQGLIVSGAVDVAIVELQSAIESWQRSFGARDARLPYMINQVGRARFKLGEYAEAERMLERAIDLFSEVVEPEHPDLVPWLRVLSKVKLSQGNHEGAQAALDRGLAIAERRLGSEHYEYGLSMVVQGAIAQAEGHDAVALARYQEARTLLEAVDGKAHPRIAEPLTAEAAMHFEADRIEEALRLARRAIAIVDTQAISPYVEINAQFVLARVLHALGRPPQQVLMRLDAAQRLGRRLPGTRYRARVDEIMAWRGRHVGLNVQTATR